MNGVVNKEKTFCIKAAIVCVFYYSLQDFGFSWLNFTFLCLYVLLIVVDILDYDLETLRNYFIFYILFVMIFLSAEIFFVSELSALVAYLSIIAFKSYYDKNLKKHDFTDV